MTIDTPLCELGSVETDALRETILAQDEIAWGVVAVVALSKFAYLSGTWFKSSRSHVSAGVELSRF